VSALNANSLGTEMAVVAVPVTAAWMHADASRPGDVAVTQPVPDMAAWMAALNHELRLDLLGRIATSALLGEPVLVVGEANGWSDVRLPWQPSSLDPRGYPAWIPSAHLAPSSASGAGGIDGVDGTGGAGVEGAGGADGADGDWSVFCVARRLVPVRASRSGPPIEVLSMGTRLRVVDVDPATGTNRAQVQVAAGEVGASQTYWIDADCGVYASTSSPVILSGDGDSSRLAPGSGSGSACGLPVCRGVEIVAAGSELLGLPYLWGGLSGWGVDCSGLVHLAYRALGYVVPRDSVDQLRVFGSVRDRPEPGQPVFFRYQTNSRRIHHVGIAVSETTMLHAPKTGRVTELLPLATEPYASELERAEAV
jgi:gamma-D-glutamyl-L-lysine dipeptidyl-peptidase